MTYIKNDIQNNTKNRMMFLRWCDVRKTSHKLLYLMQKCAFEQTNRRTMRNMLSLPHGEKKRVILDKCLMVNFQVRRKLLKVRLVFTI